jgi:hypothetical protein
MYTHIFPYLDEAISAACNHEAVFRVNRQSSDVQAVCRGYLPRKERENKGLARDLEII